MPRPTRSYGRPGTLVIPADYEESHAPVLNKTMTATVSLLPKGGGPNWDETTKRTDTNAGAPFAEGVLASIQAIPSGGVGSTIADDVVKVSGYYVRIPLDTAVDDVIVGSIILVTACADSTLLNRFLRITDIVRSTVQFERTMLAVLND